MGIILPRTVRDHKTAAWILWTALMIGFLASVITQIITAANARQNPTASVSEIKEVPFKLPSFALCPYEAARTEFPSFTGSNSSFNKYCTFTRFTGNGINTVDETCTMSLMNITIGSDFIACQFANSARAALSRNSLDTLDMFVPIQSFPPATATPEDANFEAFYIIPTELTQAEFAAQFAGAFGTDPDKSPITNYATASSTGANIGTLTKSTRKSLSGSVKVQYSIDTTAVDLNPAITLPSPANGAWHVRINLASYRVIQSEEVDTLTISILLGLIGGVYAFVPLIFGVFFGEDPDSGEYHWRGVKGCMTAAWESKTDIAGSAPIQQAQEMSSTA